MPITERIIETEGSITGRIEAITDMGIVIAVLIGAAGDTLDMAAENSVCSTGEDTSFVVILAAADKPMLRVYLG